MFYIVQNLERDMLVQLITWIKELKNIILEKQNLQKLAFPKPWFIKKVLPQIQKQERGSIF